MLFAYFFLKRYTWRTFIIEDTDDEQRHFAAKLKNLDKDKRELKTTFLWNFNFKKANISCKKIW